MEKRCVIIIPVYKKFPSTTEKAALTQALTILSAYQFYFVCANELDVSEYETITVKFPNVNISVKRFNGTYFSTIAGYNKLMLSLTFYQQFSSFKFMLIYQLDAWVFRNELAYWCNQDYDYIGAPWYENQQQNCKFVGVGNGGFSLRKISSHIRILKSFSLVIKPGYFYYLLTKDFSLKNVKIVLKCLFFSNNTFHWLNDFSENEDRFWGLIAVRNFTWFKTPPEKIALKFAVETYPSHFIKSDADLPFGCHAWEKYDNDFWSSHIKLPNNH
ncbi:DUF5672 family protein [Pedobacter namyangjuensis]|uniref:DUF5672 family protein n=1 Tax=Pedobacter namyangjuensis TaxID=600626 RepID=UPI000DE36A98|nr:DUF5672 family protein [Pedobacter namyangjuensis]